MSNSSESLSRARLEFCYLCFPPPPSLSLYMAAEAVRLRAMLEPSWLSSSIGSRMNTRKLWSCSVRACSSMGRKSKAYRELGPLSLPLFLSDGIHVLFLFRSVPNSISSSLWPNVDGLRWASLWELILARELYLGVAELISL